MLDEVEGWLVLIVAIHRRYRCDLHRGEGKIHEIKLSESVAHVQLLQRLGGLETPNDDRALKLGRAQ